MEKFPFFIAASFFTLFGASPAFSKECKQPPQESCPDGRSHYRTSIRHIESGGIGYDTGYTTLEIFLASDPNQWAVMPFFDARGHIFDNGKWAANAGAGLRALLGKRAYGINTYYDYRNTSKLNYNQIGLGLETLGQIVDFRINGYLPVGKKISSPYSTTSDGFSGHYYLLSQKYQFSMKGADAEFGFHFGKTKDFDFYAAAGPYYFIGEIGPNLWGGKVRAGGNYKEMVGFEISDSYDPTFHNKFQGQISLSFSFGPKSKITKGSNTCEFVKLLTDRMLQPVEREEIVVVDHKRKHSKAIDPATGLPYYFIFVDNTSNSKGTFKSPYHSLVQAQENSKPYDIIYVYNGDGTTKGMDAGITLKNNQKLWGSNLSYTLPTTLGNIIIAPGSTTAPIITNTAGNAITLGSNNEISGFTISEAFNSAIFGTNPKNVLVSSCNIIDCGIDAGDQISLSYTTSGGTIDLNKLVITGGVYSQIGITSTTEEKLALNIDSCIIQTSEVYSLDFSSTNKVAVSVTNNQFLNNTNGSLFTLDGLAALEISGNTFSGQTSVSDFPVTIMPGSSPIAARFKNNAFNDNEIGSVIVSYDGTASTILTFVDNSFTGNGTGSAGVTLGSNIVINANGNTVDKLVLRLLGNTFTENDSYSLYINPSGVFTELHATVHENTMSDNGTGALAFGSDVDTFTLRATHNTMTNLNDNAIGIVGSSSISNANVTVKHNTITNIAGFGNGFAFAQPATDLHLTLSNNDIEECEGSGILCYSTEFTTMNAIVTNNLITDCENQGSNAASGIDIEQYGDFAGIVENNILSGNLGTYAVAIGSTVTAPNACLDLSGNTCDTAYLLTNPGDGDFNLSPCNVETVNTGSLGTSGTFVLVQSCEDPTVCP